MTCRSVHVGYVLVRHLHLRPDECSEARNGQAIDVEVADGV